MTESWKMDKIPKRKKRAKQKSFHPLGDWHKVTQVICAICGKAFDSKGQDQTTCMQCRIDDLRKRGYDV